MRWGRIWLQLGKVGERRFEMGEEMVTVRELCKGRLLGLGRGPGMVTQ